MAPLSISIRGFVKERKHFNVIYFLKDSYFSLSFHHYVIETKIQEHITVK